MLGRREETGPVVSKFAKARKHPFEDEDDDEGRGRVSPSGLYRFPLAQTILMNHSHRLRPKPGSYLSNTVCLHWN
jgi:hypothetical protein